METLERKQDICMLVLRNCSADAAENMIHRSSYTNIALSMKLFRNIVAGFNFHLQCMKSYNGCHQQGYWPSWGPFIERPCISNIWISIFACMVNSFAYWVLQFLICSFLAGKIPGFAFTLNSHCTGCNRQFSF